MVSFPPVSPPRPYTPPSPHPYAPHAQPIKIYITIILIVVLYGCETWSLTLSEDRKLKGFENRVLWGLFGAEREEVTGELRKLHNEALNDLYCSPNIVGVIKSRMRWVEDVARIGKRRGVYRVFVGKPDGKRLFGRQAQMGG